MLLKQQAFAAMESHQGANKLFQYAYLRNHTPLQFFSLKLAEWIAWNLADELCRQPDLYRGVMRARCYPFNMAQHRFRGKNVKVRDLLQQVCRRHCPQPGLHHRL